MSGFWYCASQVVELLRSGLYPVALRLDGMTEFLPRRRRFEEYSFLPTVISTIGVRPLTRRIASTPSSRDFVAYRLRHFRVGLQTRKRAVQRVLNFTCFIFIDGALIASRTSFPGSMSGRGGEVQRICPRSWRPHGVPVPDPVGSAEVLPDPFGGDEHLR